MTDKKNKQKIGGIFFGKAGEVFTNIQLFLRFKKIVKIIGKERKAVEATRGKLAKLYDGKIGKIKKNREIGKIGKGNQENQGERGDEKKKIKKADLKFIPLSEIAKKSAYSKNYINFSARQGKLKAEKIKGIWHTTEEWLAEFTEKSLAKKNQFKEKLSHDLGGSKKFVAEETAKREIGEIGENREIGASGRSELIGKIGEEIGSFPTLKAELEREMLEKKKAREGLKKNLKEVVAPRAVILRMRRSFAKNWNDAKNWVRDLGGMEGARQSAKLKKAKLADFWKLDFAKPAAAIIALVLLMAVGNITKADLASLGDQGKKKIYFAYNAGIDTAAKTVSRISESAGKKIAEVKVGKEKFVKIAEDVLQRTKIKEFEKNTGLALRGNENAKGEVAGVETASASTSPQPSPWQGEGVVLAASTGTTGAAQTNIGDIEVSVYLMDGENKELTNGEYDVRFGIYTTDRTESDPSPSDTDKGTRVWEETQKVIVENGLLKTYLGATTPIPASFNFAASNYYIGIRVGEDAEMTPRKRIGAVPLARTAMNIAGQSIGNGAGNIPVSNGTLNTNLNADLLDGLHSTAFQVAGSYQPAGSYDNYLAWKLQSVATDAGQKITTNKGAIFTGANGIVTSRTLNTLTISLDPTYSPTFSDITANGNLNLTASTNLIFGGTTSLGETTSPTDSGAFMVGVFDEFTSSASTNVQGVLKDLDTAIGGGGGGLWTLAAGTIHPTDLTNNLEIGGGYGATGVSISNAGNIQANGNLTVDGTITSGLINSQTISALANFTGTGTFASTLTASNGLALTTGALNLTSTSGTLTLSGLLASSISTGANNLTITSGNFNTTATGINSTAIGATTAGTGAFTTLSSSGITNLGTAGASAVNIATTGTGATTIGNATGTFQLISSGGLNITTGGAMTGVASLDTINTSSTALTFTGTAPTISVSTAATAINLEAGTTGEINIGSVSSGNVNIAAQGTGNILLAGGSGSTGCTITNSNGNLDCSGSITGSSSGTVGFWSRTGTTLSTATANDAVSLGTGGLASSGNISTSGTGTITSNALLTASNGLALTTGALNLTATSGTLTISGLLASSINTGANNLTITSGNFNTTATGINSTAIGATTAGTGAFTTLSSSGITNLGTAGASAVNIATTGTGATTIGNATGTFQLISSGGLNVTTGGALTGVASIDTINVSGTALTFTGTAPTISVSTAATAINLEAGTTGEINIGSVSSGNVNIAAQGTGNILLAGGSGSTGCTITNSNGNLDCSGSITGSSSGTVGFWSRSGNTLSTATANDAVSLGTGGLASSGNISTSGTGTITSNALLTASNGLALTTGDLNLTATSGTLTLSGLLASSISTGANNLTITSGAFNTTATGINSTNIGATTAGTGAFTTLSSSGITNLGTTGASAVNIATTGTGAVTIGNATGTFQLISSGGLNVSTGGALTGVASLDTINTSSTALTFTGTAPTISVSTAATAINLEAGTTGEINIGSVSSGNVNIAAQGTGNILLAGGSLSTGCTITNSNGNLDCSGSITGSSSGTVGFWTRTGTNLLPATAGDDLYLPTNSLLGVGYDPATFSAGTVAAFNGNVGIGTTSLSGAKFKISNGSSSVSDSYDDQSKIASASNTTVSSSKLQNKEAICGTYSVQDANGNSYNTVSIGSQCWMASNINVGSTVPGASNQTNNSVTEKYCYADNTANCTAKGGLYQWNEAMQYSAVEGSRGICMAGWHIPTDTEWKTMEMSQGMSQAQADLTGYRGTTEGDKLKDSGLCQGRTPCDTSGFNGLLAGYRTTDGSFYGLGSIEGSWSSSVSGGDAWARSLYIGEARVYRGTTNQSNGFSVRCVKD